MGPSGARQRDGLPLGAGGPAFDLFAAKLRRPLMRPGTVRRLPLIERLAQGELPPDCLGGRATGLWKDDAAVAVG